MNPPKIKCPDCQGSGFIGGGQAVIYCPCPVGEDLEMRDMDARDEIDSLDEREVWG